MSYFVSMGITVPGQLTIEKLLQADVQHFIKSHLLDDPHQLLLKYDQVGGVAIRDVVAQMVGWRKAQVKLPTYSQTDGIVYPPSINLEQSSSEATALFKSRLFTGKRAADLTGGFGIDSFFLAKQFQQVDYVEPSLELLQVARHNHKTLGAENIRHQQATAEEFLSRTHEIFDLVYLDPSRRVGGKKVVQLQDYAPNVIALQPHIFNISDNALIKVSPLLDIQAALRALQSVKRVFVVSVENDCKELIFHCAASHAGEAEIEALDLSTDGKAKQKNFRFTFSEERATEVRLAAPERFLYEPNASILKAGAFKSVAAQHNLKKIARHTHFYTADFLAEDFPGRTFEITAQIKPDPKEIKRWIPALKANVVTRNYPLHAVALRNKLRLQDGGDDYVIACSGERNKFVLVARRIK
ncbi:MAG: SAM-dependent methyltransferase [Cyclobacteriaceae bacterium]